MDNRALLSKAQGLLNQNQARAAWRLLRDHAPSSPDADLLYFCAFAATQCGELADAQRALDACLALAPQHPGAHFQRGLLALDEGDHAQALVGFREAARHAPGWGDAHYNLGVVQAELGDGAAAEASYHAALRASPTMVQAANNLANLLLARGERAQAIALLQQAVSRAPTFAEGWCSLGYACLTTRELDKAAQASERALSLRDPFPAAWENLGEIRRQQGRPNDALKAFERALAQDPGNERLQFKIASLRGENPTRPPDAYVRQLFDDMAGEFDTHLVDELGYRLPRDLETHLQGVLNGPASLDVLDLGCGTGLAGVHIKPWARHLIGVDLSPRMLQAARERGVYDDLIEASLQDVLAAAQAASRDLLIATDVFVYVGDLAPVLRQAHRTLRPGGCLLFSVERCDDELDFVLRPSGRYAHSSATLRHWCEAEGFAIERESGIPLRKEGDTMLEGLVVRARRV